MKIILISNNADKVRTLSLNSWAKGLLSVLLLGLPVAAGTMLGIKIADGRWELLTVGDDHEACRNAQSSSAT